MKIDPDTGGRLDFEPQTPETVAVEPQTTHLGLHGLIPAPEIAEVIAGALAGTLPLTRELGPTELTSFSTRHISLVLDAAQGKKPKDLALRYDYSLTHVYNIINHPFSQQIFGTIMAHLADRVADPSERIKGYAHEALNVKVEIMRDRSTPKQLRNHVASDLLDRAGFGARQRVEVSKGADALGPTVPSTEFGRLADALSESKTVRADTYQAYVSKPEGQEPALVLPESGTPRTGALPSGPSLLASDEEAAA